MLRMSYLGWTEIDGSTLCVSSIELFRDTLLRVTTDGGCEVSRQIILVAFTIEAREKPKKGKVLYDK